jgi:hypothetical protein
VNRAAKGKMMQQPAVLDPQSMQYLDWIKQTNPTFNPGAYSSPAALNQFKQLVNTPTSAQNIQQKMLAGLMRPPPGTV